jgi:hypothetical protein
MSRLRFKGVVIYMNGGDYLVPSLSLEQFERHHALLTEPVEPAEGAALFAQYRKYIPVMALALQRNYPEVTEADLFGWLDLHTFRETFLAVQAASGLEVVAPGE